MQFTPEYITEKDVSSFTGVSLSTLRRWRLMNEGPPWLKFGGAVRYPVAALRSWIEARPGGGEARHRSGGFEVRGGARG
jgi:predicted DNA-binding transcriptional regulator AlpA